LLKTGALQNAISPRQFSIIATDEKRIIQLFNVGAERMLAIWREVVNRISRVIMHDPLEVIGARAALASNRTTLRRLRGMAFKASRGTRHYRLTYNPQGRQPLFSIVSNHGAAR